MSAGDKMPSWGVSRSPAQQGRALRPCTACLHCCATLLLALPPGIAQH